MYLGIEVSERNNHIVWSVVREASVSTVAIEVTRGDLERDGNYLANLHGAQAVGLRTVAYHVGKPSISSAAREAENFAMGVGFRDMSPHYALDLTDPAVPSGVQLVEYVREFADAVREQLNGELLLYTSYEYARDHGLFDGSNFAAPGLWLRQWQTLEPSSFPGYATWHGWQFTDDAFIPGVGHCSASLWRYL